MRVSDCGTDPGRMICYCLQVSEAVILDALHRFELRTVKEVRQHTGAGDGCTACHGDIRRLLEQHCSGEGSMSATVHAPG
jgi:bacterioferritin-associated ferredoxin